MQSRVCYMGIALHPAFVTLLLVLHVHIIKHHMRTTLFLMVPNLFDNKQKLHAPSGLRAQQAILQPQQT